MKKMNKKTYVFNAAWLSGFTQADGSFGITWEKKRNPKALIPYTLKPFFVLTQSILELDMMEALHSWLGVGIIAKNRESVYIRVTSISDIIRVILPLFDSCSLLGQKQIHYLMFKKVVFLMSEKLHLRGDGLIQLLWFSYLSNSSSTRTEKSQNEIFALILKNNPNLKLGEINPLPAIKWDSQERPGLLTVPYLVGLVEGDGSFNVAFLSKTRKVNVNFTITVGLDDLEVVENVQKTLKCGTIVHLKVKAVRFQTNSLVYINKHVLPFFEKAIFNTVKGDHFKVFAATIPLILENNYKTNDKEFLKIIDLAYNMNRNGKNRKISKEQYISLWFKTPAPIKKNKG